LATIIFITIGSGIHNVRAIAIKIEGEVAIGIGGCFSHQAAIAARLRLIAILTDKLHPSIGHTNLLAAILVNSAIDMGVVVLFAAYGSKKEYERKAEGYLAFHGHFLV